MITRIHERIFQERIRVISSQIADLLDPGEMVLDLGCGDGTLARKIVDQVPGLRIVGADTIPRSSVAIDFSLYDGVRLPFGDGAFDGVILVDVLHHTENPAAVLAEALRVSRRFLVIKDHLREGWLARPTLRIMDWVGNARYGVDLPYNYLNQKEWDGLFAQLDVTPLVWRDRIGLYRTPLNWFFERSLHFIARLERRNTDRAEVV